MRLISNASSFLHRLVTQPSAEFGKGKRALHFFATLSWFCARELKKDNATQMAAALTYRTMFSLLPMLVLALIVLQAFRGLEGYQDQFKQTVVTFLLPPELLNRDTQTGEFVPGVKEDSKVSVEAGGGAASQPATVTLAETGDKTGKAMAQTSAASSDTSPIAVAQSPVSTSVAPSATTSPGVQAEAAGPGTAKPDMQGARALLGDSIQQILDSLQNVNFSRIGWVGLLVFIYGATTLLETVEKSFNVIFDVEQGRPWYLRVTFYYTVVTLGPLVIIAGQIAQQRLVGMIVSGAWTNWLAGPMAVLTPVLTTWLVLLVMFMLLPHAKVRLRSAAVGSLLTAVLWVISKELFAIYATRTAVTSLYGALALVPLFLLWVYVTWVIVLFGLELAFTLQEMRGRRFKRHVGSVRHRELCDSTTVISLMAMVAQAFETGELVRSEQMADRLGLPMRVVRLLIHKLEDAHLIHQVHNREEGVEGYALAQPPERIGVSQLLALGEDLTMLQTQSTAALPGQTCLEALRLAQRQAASDQTLADICPHAHE